MIKFKSKLGDFEFDRVENLIAFTKSEFVEDFDMMQFGYLISNVAGPGHTKLVAFTSKGLNALLELRVRGMEAMVKELKS